MKTLEFLGACVVSLGLLQAAAAQNYPAKPIRLVVPYQAGQGTDVAARLIADQLSKALGQAIIVDNRAGAGGNIGAFEAGRAAPDGYTLLMGTNGTHVLNQMIYPSMSFDPEKDFEPIGIVSTFPMVVVANPASPYNSVADLLKDAKAKTEGIDIALPSTTARLVLELLKEKTGGTLRPVPYKGSGTAMTDIIGGQVMVGIDTASAVRTFISSGKLKALGVTSAQASALLPQVKPVAAQGVDGFEVIAWNAMYAPHGTPAPVIQRLSAELTKVMAQPDVRQRLLELGHEPAAGGAPKELAMFARSERQKWGPLVKSAGLKAE
ncbi:Bug family tripartite tricarboxylate transporter substrate binding protein [Variovorax sp. Root411]|uniref:Bug family tripartite tricarboxylate transporter substrate binding protein n=1 Tax=Variovorax sp. Root411 TaxID=1736530 RepID=UPI0006F7ED3F|nr:tripartite tricarboxylate transporter substrate binding protein [Variovorax sp. Root411]KQW56578.1 twin-arginine translocation pathway signal [Variovorax sp. Root411]